MSSLFLLSTALLSLLSIGDAKVEFKYSTMYDIFDFKGVNEVPLPRCEKGCLIFASTLGVHPENPDGIDTYMKNLIVSDGKDPIKSIGEIARQFDGSTKKLPLSLEAKKTYSIKNLNDKNAQGSDVTVWIIEKAIANGFNYEIYDPVYMNRATTVPNSIITIMSAARFFVKAEKGQPISLKARLVGFDNALDNNEDQCLYTYYTLGTQPFDGFEFHINAPIISFAFTDDLLARKPINIKADFMYLTTRNLAQSAFITSPGYNGCKKVENGQVYHSLTYGTSDEFELHCEPDYYSVDFIVDMVLPEGNQIRIKDMTNSVTMPVGATDPAEVTFTFPDTQFIIVSYDDLKPLDTFLIRYTSTQSGKQPEIKQSTPTISTTSPITTTSPKITPTTSASAAISGVITVVSVLLVTIFG